MKKSTILLSFLALSLVSCKKDPWSAVEKGDWNNDRSIIEIKFAGQAGVAGIEDTDAETGTINIRLASFLVEDKSKVGIEKLVTSYKAETSVNKGDFLDFSNGATPQISVTSPTGKTRVYTVSSEDFDEDILGCYSVKSAWVWGGTGPEYGGGALMNPADKSWCWNARGGYGPSAEYDDYLEFTLDEITSDGNTRGKCVHYGGADGKNWNCIFASGMNKEGATDIDLHKFYRQIPLGESSWLRNYTDNTVSFSDKDGKVTVATLLDKGKYVVGQNNGVDKELEVPGNAFRFALSGTDDWTNIYNDYDKFVKRPRTFFVLVEKVGEIPSDSKTGCDEGDISIKEPEPEPEPTLDIAGSWKVRSLNVYGGSDSPAFVKPVDKNWCFNNVGAESDNILTITPSEGSPLTGTAEYSAGADGKFWDYVFLAKFNKADNTKDIDCTKFYGWLPHGESAYSIDVDAMTISFKSGAVTYTVPVLIQGDYKYGEKTLNIPAGCIGLDWPCNGTKGSSSWWYTDFDRFAQCPLNYVMIFEKQN